MAVALREKTLKLTPPLTIVAPSGELRPGVTVGVYRCVDHAEFWSPAVTMTPPGYSFNPQCRYLAKVLRHTPRQVSMQAHWTGWTASIGRSGLAGSGSIISGDRPGTI